jgi:hypothetical protein
MGTFGVNGLPQNPYGWQGPLLSDGEQKMAPQTGNTTASAVAVAGTVISASTAYNIINNNCRGALFYLRPTAFPGSGSTTIALKIRMLTDPVAGGGAQPVIAAFGATNNVSGSTGYAFVVYPTAITGALSATSVVSPLPRNYQIFLSLSTGATSKEVTFSLSVMHLV